MAEQIYAKEYEDYLITGKEESLNSLASSSIEKDYFFLIRRLLNEKLTRELQNKINDFLKRISESQSYRLKALNIYKKIQNSSKKEEIIKDIKQLFGIGNPPIYQRPSEYNEQFKNNNGEKEEEEEEEEKENKKEKDGKDKLSNKLIIEEFDIKKKFIENIYANKIDPNDTEYEIFFESSDEEHIFLLDFDKIPEKTIVKILLNSDLYEKILPSLLFALLKSKKDHFKKVVKLLVAEVTKNKKLLDNFKKMIDKHYMYFRSDHLKALLEYNNKLKSDQLVAKFIERKYEENPEDKKEIIKNLKEIKKILNDYNYKDDKMTRNVLISLLKINSELNIYDKDIFLEYIKCPLFDSSIYNLSTNIREKIENNENQRDYFKCQISVPNKQNEKVLVESHLKHFYLKKKMKFATFSKYFEEKYIKNFYAKMQFYLDNKEYKKFLSSYEINDLMNETILLISKYNKESFNINEDVVLNLEIKNINVLHVNIYEINTENYYYLNKKEFNEYISLDGIVPTYEDIYSYNDKPQLLLEKKITITKVPKKRGLYVIEFIGNGHVSRAVIQKGNLTCIHKNTFNGKVLYILDEDNKVCKGEQTGIWINNEWYPSILDTGAILIPYSIKADSLILKHNDFCCLKTDIVIPDEEYTFDGLFIINPESFIFGNLTKILVRPYLFVCKELCPLEILNNVKISINSTIIENNQEIPSAQVIDNIKLSYNEEYSFDFQVPPKLKHIEFILSAEIKPKTKNDIKILKFNKCFDFTRKYEYDSLVKQDDSGNYILHLLGRNGEPKKKYELELNLELFEDAFENRNFEKSIILETSNEGTVDLGRLENIKKIEMNSKKIIGDKIPKYTYKSEITILENKEINLPFSKTSSIYLFKCNKDQQSILENISDLLKIKVTDEKNKLCNLTLPKLSKGYYNLIIGKKEIFINVVKGKVMDMKDFILTDNGKIIYNKDVEEPIAIENVTYKNNEIKIKLNKSNKSNTKPRIHIDLVQYFPKNNNFANYMEHYHKYIKENEEKSFEMNTNKNIYLNNKILSDEIQYILDRKQCETILGNSLEKPSLLLKPQYIRDTTTEIKKGKEGENFNKDMNCGRACYDRAMKRSDSDSDREKDEELRVHDFINVSPYIEDNLVPDEKGEIIIKNLNFSDYSFLHILCFDNISCCEQCFHLNSGKTSLRDLRAVNELDFDKNYCEFRKLYPLSKNEKHHLKDITSIQYKIFDSLEKYVEFIKIINPSLQNDIKQFEFLLNFNFLNLSEKLEKITKFFSHELNIYLFFHHNKFFNKYIYPILKYKSEKTFIDYFLLDDKEKILEYMKYHINKLNTFEKCLLIYAIRKSNKLLANHLARKIRSECPREDPREIKKMFNTALNLKTFEEKVEEITWCKREVEDVDLSEDEIEEERVPIRASKKSYCKYKNCKKKKKIIEKDDMSEESLDFQVNKDFADKINAKAQLFKEEGKSKEFCETHYFDKVFKNSAIFIESNHFFADLAQFWCKNNDSERNIGFKTDNLLTKPKNFTEFMFMISVLDLEEKSFPDSQKFIKDKGLGITIEANANIYLLTKEINETKLSNDNKYSLVLAQMIFEKNAKNEEENEQSKLLTNRTYLLKTIVTNISPETINCEILMQIPEGSIPVDSDEYKIIENANINSYKSVVFEQKFYFPEEGIFKLYPSSAFINNLVIAKSGIKTYEVVSSIKLSKEEITSIEDVLNQGKKKEILEFIKKSEIITEEDLSKIYWLLKDKDFYNQLINILKNKYLFDKKIWEYSYNYEDFDSMQESLFNKNNKEKLNIIGNEIDYKFLKIDKTNNAHILNHLDYYPIINTRVFRLPKSQSILNVQLRNTYKNYISYLITLPKINDYEYMRLCYYLILQQRIKEATIVFNKIDKNNIIGNNVKSLELQYDYLTVYLDFSNGYPKLEKARQICKKYQNIPILSWHNMFNEIESQLNEYDEKVDYENEINDTENKLSKEDLAHSEEFLSIEIKNKDINVIYRNLSNITIKYYLIDTEILFSRMSFEKSDFNYIKPQITENIKVKKEINENIHSVEIPKDLKNKNFYIEVSSGSKRDSKLYNSYSLTYSIFESVGEIKVMTPERTPLPKVYVKCLCKTKDGTCKFYKDGFTDLRGKFDYVSLNNDIVNKVKTFDILLVSKDYGSLVITFNPPKLIKDGKKVIS